MTNKRWPQFFAFLAWLAWLGLSIWLDFGGGWIVAVGIVGAFLVLAIGAELEETNKPDISK